MSGLLLDTHVWLWLQTGDGSNFSSSTLREIEKAQRRGELYLSAISVLEVARLEAMEQYDLGMPVEAFLEQAMKIAGLKLVDLSTNILIASTRLPGEFHRDPSDRLIVATARNQGLTLLTKDRAILDYARQGHVSVLKL